jgi:hypothetical protein
MKLNLNEEQSNKDKPKYRYILKLPEWFDKKKIEYKEASGGEIIIETCPACGRERKLYVEPETGVAQCKYAGCDFNNGISPVALVQGLLNCSKKEAWSICYKVIERNNNPKNIFDLDESENSEDDLEYTPTKKKVEERPLPVLFPLHSEDLSKEKHPLAWQYLVNRGYTDEIISQLKAKVLPYKTYNEGFAALSKLGMPKEQIMKILMYLNRIIFPLYVNDELMGYIARDFIGRDSKWKVLNSEGSFRRWFFWNYDNVKESETLVITEGITDAMKCGLGRAIAVLGTAVTDEQFKLIMTTKAKKIILALDVGTEKSKNHIFDELYLYYPGQIFEVKFPELLTQKKSLLNPRIIEAIQELPTLTDDIKYWAPNELILPHHVFQDLKKKLEAKWFILNDYDYRQLQEFVDNAGYKDAGDYSLSEMDKMIEEAQLFQKYLIFDEKKDR